MQKFAAYKEARQHLSGYENAAIGFRIYLDEWLFRNSDPSGSREASTPSILKYSNRQDD